MKRIYLFLPLLLIAACERELEIDLSKVNPELVVIANFSDLDTLEVVVAKTRPVLETGPAEYVSDATVHIYDNGAFIDRLTFVPSPIPQFPSYYLSPSLVPQPGRKYTISVSAPGFPSVEATSEIPFPIEINTGASDLSIEEKAIDANTALVNFFIDLHIPLPVPKPSYFHLNFYQQVHSFQINEKGDTIQYGFFSLPLGFTSQNPDLPFVSYVEERGVLFGNDALFNNHGKISFTGSFQFRPNEQRLGNFLVELRTVSPEYYFYHRSLARLSLAGSDPFSEPVILYSNIENGQGVFAGFMSRFYVFDIPR
jgi:hypothetical protein